MANRAGTITRTAWLPVMLIAVGRWLLLVPEAALIAALLCVYSVLGHPPLVALLAALLILGFITRTLALHWARAALEAANNSAALVLAKIALCLYPWSADALALQGTVALANGLPEMAERALRRALALLPGQAAYYAALSGALLEQGRSVEAAAAARQALALNGRNPLAHLYLAETEHACGAPSHVIEEHLRSGLAVARIPEVTVALQCSLASHLLTERRLAEATLALHAAEALIPRCAPARQAEIRLHLGELLAEQGQVERAREQFHNAEALDPQGRFATAWRGARL